MIRATGSDPDIKTGSDPDIKYVFNQDIGRTCRRTQIRSKSRMAAEQVDTGPAFELFRLSRVLNCSVHTIAPFLLIAM